MLCSYLASHSQVRMFFELFHRHLDSIPFSAPGYRAKSKDPHLVALRNQDPVGFLKTEIFKPYLPSTKAVGFKLLYPQARADDPWWNTAEFDRWWHKVGHEPSWKNAKSDLWAYLKSDPEIAIIHLKRQNLLRAQVSAFVAQSTGYWGAGATGGIGEKTAVKLELNAEELQQDFAAARRMEQEADQLFSSHKKLSLTYEQLVGEPEEVLQKVQNFLGLELQQLQTQTRKQAWQPISDAIANYNELKQHFNGTPWQEFFEE